MSDDARLDPLGLKPSDTNADVMQTLGGVAAWGPLALPTALAPMVSIDENGYPGLIFDEFGNIYRTEEG